MFSPQYAIISAKFEFKKGVEGVRVDEIWCANFITNLRKLLKKYKGSFEER